MPCPETALVPGATVQTEGRGEFPDLQTDVVSTALCCWTWDQAEVETYLIIGRGHANGRLDRGCGDVRRGWSHLTANAVPINPHIGSHTVCSGDLVSSVSYRFTTRCKSSRMLRNKSISALAQATSAETTSLENGRY